MKLRDLQRNWNEFGQQDPLWSILTDPTKQGNRWDVDEFLATGVSEIAREMAIVQSLGIVLQDGEALDFGCGVGRLTLALSAYFKRAVGVDIAESMIEGARSLVGTNQKCAYILNEKDDLSVFPSDSFSFVYCNYVLQHMQPEYSARYIADFIRIVRPGGLVIFQLPSERRTSLRERVKGLIPQGAVRALKRLRDPAFGYGPIMETYEVPRSRVEQILTNEHAQLLHARQETEHDTRWTSLVYYVTKPSG